jgi:cell wall-associated NlpC family hydrolase
VTYTVVSGDSLWTIAQKFNCSVKSLKKVNNLTKKNLKPGQVLKIPPLKSKATSPATTIPAAKPAALSAPKKKATHQKLYAKAQPVQDFDIPASTMATCPVPDPAAIADTPASKPAATTPESDTTPTSAPVAQLVTPDELSADAAATAVATPAPKPKPVAKSAPVPVAVAVAQPEPAPPMAIHDEPSPAPSYTTSSSKQSGRYSAASSAPTSSNIMSNDWAARFMQEAKQLSDVGLEYDEDWRPPGESHAWAMDCSNTSRYLYKVTTGLELPRTASDQYYYLHLQNKAWDVPQGSDGYADTSYLRENLKPGDLLFWENTYRPERQPPITHVMVYLGTDDKGQWLMAGSQSSHGGFHNRRGGGPDIYVFDPHKPSGGYTTWLGLVRHKGRFCAYGRPLEADPAKLSVASN